MLPPLCQQMLQCCIGSQWQALVQTWQVNIVHKIHMQQLGSIQLSILLHRQSMASSCADMQVSIVHKIHTQQLCSIVHTLTLQLPFSGYSFERICFPACATSGAATACTRRLRLLTRLRQCASPVQHSGHAVSHKQVHLMIVGWHSHHRPAYMAGKHCISCCWW